MATSARRLLTQLFSAYGMLLVLLLLAGYFGVATYTEESPTGVAAATSLAATIAGSEAKTSRIVVVSQLDPEEAEFAAALRQKLTDGGYSVTVVQGDPPTVRAGLEKLAGGKVDLIATTQACRGWTVFDSLRQSTPAFSGVRVEAPQSGRRSAFFSPSNLRNVADQISVIAIMAVGMTMVIVTGGIDLSVGSLLALAAVTTAWLLHRWGGPSASVGAMFLASGAAIVLCSAVGGFSAAMITVFRIPPFIATLAIMQVASGLAFIIARGQTIYDVPDSFAWLGRGLSVAGLPNAVLLMVAIYVAAHLLMTHTVMGRRIYATGGNPLAAHLAGVPIDRTLFFVYIMAGLTAGIGGVITVSQLKAGAPTYGLGYELYVIAAVVVGGTSLSGGQGRIFGTLIGAFIIAVIRNGMNLMNIEPYTQKVVLGLVILGAVLLDMLKRRGRA